MRTARHPKRQAPGGGGIAINGCGKIHGPSRVAQTLAAAGRGCRVRCDGAETCGEFSEIFIDRFLGACPKPRSGLVSNLQWLSNSSTGIGIRLGEISDAGDDERLECLVSTSGGNAHAAAAENAADLVAGVERPGEFLRIGSHPPSGGLARAILRDHPEGRPAKQNHHTRGTRSPVHRAGIRGSGHRDPGVGNNGGRRISCREGGTVFDDGLASKTGRARQASSGDTFQIPRRAEVTQEFLPVF